MNIHIVKTTVSRYTYETLETIVTMGSKMAPHRGYYFLQRLTKENHKNIFMSETIRTRALIFDMNHHLVNPYYN